MASKQVDILFLSHRYEVTSGGEKALLDMIRYLVTIGIKPHVIIGSTGSIVEHLDSMSVPYSVVYLPFWMHDGNDPTPFEFTSLNPTVNTVRQIVNLINELKPKLCVTNTMVMPWLGYASSMCGVPHAWFIHELRSGFNFHYAIGEEQTLRTIDNLADKIFYNSKHTSEYYLSKFKYNTDASIVYPVGSTPLNSTTISSPYSRSSSLKLAVVGQLKTQKSQLDAVKAVSNLKDQGFDIELILVGSTEESSYETKIVDYIQKHNLTNDIKLTGHVSSPSSLMNHADIIISCAINESFGRVTVEAMSLGKPVIGANSAGTAEILDSEEHGLLYTPGDHKSLAKNIKRLAEDVELRQSIGRNAKNIYATRYGNEDVYHSFIDYYNNLPTKSSLDLSLLASVTSDFDHTVSLLNRSQFTINALRSNKAIRLGVFIKKLVRKP